MKGVLKSRMGALLLYLLSSARSQVVFQQGRLPVLIGTFKPHRPTYLAHGVAIFGSSGWRGIFLLAIINLQFASKGNGPNVYT